MQFNLEFHKFLDVAQQVVSELMTNRVRLVDECADEARRILDGQRQEWAEVETLAAELKERLPPGWDQDAFWARTRERTAAHAATSVAMIRLGREEFRVLKSRLRDEGDAAHFLLGSRLRHEPFDVCDNSVSRLVHDATLSAAVHLDCDHVKRLLCIVLNSARLRDAVFTPDEAHASLNAGAMRDQGTKAYLSAIRSVYRNFDKTGAHFAPSVASHAEWMATVVAFGGPAGVLERARVVASGLVSEDAHFAMFASRAPCSGCQVNIPGAATPTGPRTGLCQLLKMRVYNVAKAAAAPTLFRCEFEPSAPIRMRKCPPCPVTPATS